MCVPRRAWAGVVAVAVVAVLVGLRFRSVQEQWRAKAGQRLVCRHEPYESEKRKVGYAGKGAEACLRQLGCIEFVDGLTDDDHGNDWDVLWTFHYQRSLPCKATAQGARSAVPPPRRRRGPRRRFVNHCYHDAINNIAGRKSAQYILFDGMRAAYGRELFDDYVPETWLVPQDTSRILASLRQHRESRAGWALNATLVYKPDLGARGKGIRFITPSDDEAEVAAILDKNGVVQRYIANPFLLNGYKHHLRLYLVTTSIAPAHAFLFTDGLYLPASKPFAPNISHKDAAVHLTNAAVSSSACRHSEEGARARHDEHSSASNSQHQSTEATFEPQCAQSLLAYWQEVEEREGLGRRVVERVQAELKRILRRVVVSSFTVRSRRVPPCAYSCFEIHGVDIVLCVWAPVSQPQLNTVAVVSSACHACAACSPCCQGQIPVACAYFSLVANITPTPSAGDRTRTTEGAQPLKPMLLEVNHGPELYTPHRQTNDRVHNHLLHSMRRLLFPDDSAMASAWGVLQSCASRETLWPCTDGGGYEECDDTAVWDLLHDCSQQMHAGFDDVMLACPPSTMEGPFVQWAAKHARTLCCCQRHRGNHDAAAKGS